MTINEYQEKAHSFATNGGDTLAYAILGLIEELGEVCGKIHFEDNDVSELITAMKVLGASSSKCAKHIRKDWDQMDLATRVLIGKSYHTDEGFSKELGDCLWMLANIAHHTDNKMESIMEENIAKLTDRKTRNVIIGSGDNR